MFFWCYHLNYGKIHVHLQQKFHVIYQKITMNSKVLKIKRTSISFTDLETLILYYYLDWLLCICLQLAEVKQACVGMLPGRNWHEMQGSSYACTVFTPLLNSALYTL